MAEIWSWIFEAYGGWQYDDSNQTDLPESYTDLVAGQSKYGLASEMLTVNRVEVTDSSGNTRRLIAKPQEQVEVVGLEQYAPFYVDGMPQVYRLTDGTIEVLPAPTENVDGGLTVFFERDGVSFASTDTTKTPGFASPFHRLVPIMASIAWLEIKQPNSKILVNLLNKKEIGMVELQNYYQQRWRDYRPRMEAVPQDWR